MLTRLDKIYISHGVVAITATIVNAFIGDMQHHVYIAVIYFISSLVYRAGNRREVDDV